MVAGQTIHPGATLSNAAKVIQHAADQKIASINAACVKAAGESKTQVAAPDFAEGIVGAV